MHSPKNRRGGAGRRRLMLMGGVGLLFFVVFYMSTSVLLDDNDLVETPRPTVRQQKEEKKKTSQRTEKPITPAEAMLNKEAETIILGQRRSAASTNGFIGTEPAPYNRWNQPYHVARRKFLKEVAEGAGGGADGESGGQGFDTNSSSSTSNARDLLVHVVVPIRCMHHYLWQTIALERTWDRLESVENGKGFFTRLVSGCRDISGDGDDHFVSHSTALHTIKQVTLGRPMIKDLSRFGTFFTPYGYGKLYRARPEVLAWWLKYVQFKSPAEDVLLILDSDTLLQRPIPAVIDDVMNRVYKGEAEYDDGVGWKEIKGDPLPDQPAGASSGSGSGSLSAAEKLRRDVESQLKAARKDDTIPPEPTNDYKTKTVAKFFHRHPVMQMSYVTMHFWKQFNCSRICEHPKQWEHLTDVDFKQISVKLPMFIHVEDLKALLPSWDFYNKKIMRKAERAGLHADMISLGMASVFTLGVTLVPKHELAVSGPLPPHLWSQQTDELRSDPMPFAIHYYRGLEVGEDGSTDEQAALRQHFKILEKEHKSRVPITDYFYFDALKVPSDYPKMRSKLHVDIMRCNAPLLQEFHSRSAVPKQEHRWRKAGFLLETILPEINGAIVEFKKAYCGRDVSGGGISLPTDKLFRSSRRAASSAVSGQGDKKYNLRKLLRTSYAGYWISRYDILIETDVTMKFEDVLADQQDWGIDVGSPDV